jgi:enamine deaminase RidA (YjgF/YER057c/UK114 family)
MSIRERLRERGIQLPPAADPAGNYVPAVRTGNLIFTAGQLPLRDGKLLLQGKIGEDGHDVEQGAAAARQCTLNALALVESMAGLDAVVRVVRLGVHVNSMPGFTGQPAVANGASDLLVEVFGEKGRHARTAVGAAELPLNAAVEIDFVFETADEPTG